MLFLIMLNDCLRCLYVVADVLCFLLYLIVVCMCLLCLVNVRLCSLMFQLCLMYVWLAERQVRGQLCQGLQQLLVSYQDVRSDAFADILLVLEPASRCDIGADGSMQVLHWTIVTRSGHLWPPMGAWANMATAQSANRKAWFVKPHMQWASCHIGATVEQIASDPSPNFLKHVLNHQWKDLHAAARMQTSP